MVGGSDDGEGDDGDQNVFPSKKEEEDTDQKVFSFHAMDPNVGEEEEEGSTQKAFSCGG